MASSIRAAAPLRLCDFPDEIVHDILCFLPIKEAVRSCVLSKRWEHLWKSLPRLCFEQTVDEPTTDRLINLADTVCRLHDPCFPIQSFKLTCNIVDDHNARCIHDLLNIVPGHEEICVYLYYHSKQEQPFTFPGSIFRSKTLVRIELCIRNNSDKLATLELPHSIHLPRLKFVRLGGIKVANLTLLHTLFSSPLLEELGIRDCFSGCTAITIHNPNLKKISFFDDLPPVRLHNCDSLEYLRYYGRLVVEILVTGRTPRKLDNVVIELHSDSVAIQGWKLLNSLSTTKNLTLFASSLQVLSSLGGERLFRLNQFDHLTELWLCAIHTWGVLVDTLLTKTPSLQSLALLGIWSCPPLDLFKTVPSCIQTQLKKLQVSIHGMKSYDVVANLLQICPVLEEMVLYSPCREWGGDKLVEKVRKFPRISANCRISLDGWIEK